MKAVWSIIGAAFALPLSASNVPHVPYTGNCGNLLVELIIKRCVENPKQLRNYFNINTCINNLLDSEWHEKTETWRQKRMQHLKHWTEAQTEYNRVLISGNGLRAAMSVKNFHPCDRFENPSHEITPFIEKAKNGNKQIWCFICASVDENNKIVCEKYLYESERHKLRCNDDFAWLNLGLKDHESDYGLCYDFRKKWFSEVSIFVQCSKQQISVSKFREEIPGLAANIKSKLFKKEGREISIDLADIAPKNKIESVDAYLEKDPHPVSLINHLKNVTDLLSAYTILQKIEDTAEQEGRLRKKTEVNRYGTLFCSLILDRLYFEAKNDTQYYYIQKDTPQKLTPFAQARFELFSKQWSCNSKYASTYFESLFHFFKPYTVVMVQNNKVLRYDALNHVVCMLKFEKSDAGKVIVSELGEVKVPKNIKVKTLHIKKDGTLIYKTRKQT